MERNSIKIVCNPLNNEITYSFKDENGEWHELSGYSPLSRQFYTKRPLQDSAADVLEKLNEIYNRKNRGLDIYFVGDNSDFDFLAREIKRLFPDKDIRLISGIYRIAVLGKEGAGKSTLIKGIETQQGGYYGESVKEKYSLYSDKDNCTEWYAIKGLELGQESLCQEILQTIKELSSNGLSAVVYCISAKSSRIESIEINFINEVKRRFPDIKFLIALTQCTISEREANDFADTISKETNQCCVIPTLAEPYSIRTKKKPYRIEPFGLDDVAKYVFEGR